jgi:hypothetical protein
MTTINDLVVSNSFSPDDKLPMWSNANGVTRALPISALTAAFLTTDDINEIAASSSIESFISDVLPNPKGLPTFTAGTTLALTLAHNYVSADNINVHFDTGFQGPDQYLLAANTLTFTAAIPAGVNYVYVSGGAVRDIGAPSDGTVSTPTIVDVAVTTPKLADGAVTTSKLATGAAVDASVAVPTMLYRRITDMVNVKDPAYGAIGDGAADDTAAIIAAITAAVTKGIRNIYFPGGRYKITSPINIAALGLTLHGDGMQCSKLIASGNFTALLQFAGTAGYVFIRDMGFFTDGTTTRCTYHQQNSVVIRYSACYFQGDLNGDLVYSNGQNLDIDKSTFQVNSANTWMVNYDCFNQNSGFTDNRGGGIGNGVRITNALTPGSNRVEGLRIENSYFINTGNNNISIDNSLLTTIVGCVLDQAAQNSLVIFGGANNVTLSDSWAGTRNRTAGTSSVLINANAGSGHIIRGCTLYGYNGVVVGASASFRVTNVTLENNIANFCEGGMFQFDSVINCVVTGNQDTTPVAPVGGSWTTLATFGAGSYTFDNNVWSTQAQSNYHAGSSYKFGAGDRGLVGKATGSASGGAATSSFTVNHGLLTTPNNIRLTPAGNAGNFWWSLATSTQFQINWTSGTTVPLWSWEADCSH